MLIKVKSVGTVTNEKKGKNTWYSFPVTYSDDRGGERTKSFKSFDKIWTEAKMIEAGKTYDVTVVKEGDYWQWTSIRESEGGSSTTPVSPKGGGNNFGRDFESKEERALRQRLIVRQSSLSSAIAYFAAQGTTASTEAVMNVATEFNDWVWKNSSPDNNEGNNNDSFDSEEIR